MWNQSNTPLLRRLSKTLLFIIVTITLATPMFGCSTDEPPPPPSSNDDDDDDSNVTAGSSGISNVLGAAMRSRLENAGMDDSVAARISQATAGRARQSVAQNRRRALRGIESVLSSDDADSLDETPADLPDLLAEMAGATPDILAEPDYELSEDEIRQYLPEAVGALAEALGDEDTLVEIVADLDSSDLSAMMADMVSEIFENILDSGLEAGALNEASKNALAQILGEYEAIGFDEGNNLSDSIQETISAAVDAVADLADDEEWNSLDEYAFYDAIIKGGTQGIEDMGLDDFSAAAGDISAGFVEGLPDDIEGDDFNNLMVQAAEAVLESVDWGALLGDGMTQSEIEALQDAIASAVVDQMADKAIDEGRIDDVNASALIDMLETTLDDVEIEYVLRPYYLWAIEGYYAESLTPTIVGYSTPGHSISLYDNSTCSGDALDTTEVDDSWMFTVTVSVTEGSINSFYATATDSDTGQTSNCSSDYAFYQQIGDDFDESDLALDAPSTPTSLALAGYFDYSTKEIVAGAFDFEANPQVSPAISGTTTAYSYVEVFGDQLCLTYRGAGYADENGDFEVTVWADAGEQDFYAKAWNYYSWRASTCSGESVSYSYAPEQASADEIGWIDADDNYTSGLPGLNEEDFFALQVRGTATYPSYIDIYDDQICGGNYLAFAATDENGNFAATLFYADETPTLLSMYANGECFDISSLLVE